MAIHRTQNFLSQQRLEASNLKSMESAVSFDFDALVGLGLSRGTPAVLKGLVLNSTGAINQLATNLTIAMAGSVVWNYSASESGSVFTISASEADQILSPTNPNVTGSFLNGTNFVGVDFYKTPDPATSDTVKFIDSDSRREFDQVVPLARTLKYKILISTQPFSATLNVVPIAKVIVSNGIVNSITDARPMLFRLGSGGDAPSATSSYLWGSRTENPVTISSNTGASPFNGEDKSINNLKDWADTIMTSLWELRGGTSWYSNVYRDHVKLVYGAAVMKNGDNIWFMNGEQIIAGDLDKTGTSIVTVTFVDHPFTVGSRFSIDIDAADSADFASGSYTVDSVPDADHFTYNDSYTASVATTTQVAGIIDTVAFSGMSLLFENSGSDTIYKNDITSGSMIVPEYYCVYVDLDRTSSTAVNPQARPIYDLGSPVLPGRRHIIAWREQDYVWGKDKNYEAGRTFIAATTSALGLVKINQTAGAPTAPVVVSIMANGRIQVTASGGNATAATFTGNGTGSGVLGQAGASNGADGVRGLAGAGISSNGVHGLGNGSIGGIGVLGEGGAGASSQGVAGRATAAGGIGVAGSATGSADYGVAGSGPTGVYGIGQSSGPAVKGENVDSGPGGEFIGGTNSAGVTGAGDGMGSGGEFTSGAAGDGAIGTSAGGGRGIVGQSTSGGGIGVYGFSTTGFGGSFNGGTGTGVVVEGDNIGINVLDGDIVLASATACPIVYGSAPTYTSFGSVHDSRVTTSSTTWSNVVQSGGAFDEGYVLNTGSTSSVPASLTYRIRVPKNAVITGVNVYAYQQTGDVGTTLQTAVFVRSSGVTRATTYLNTGGAAGDVTGAIALASYAKLTAPIAGTHAMLDTEDLYVSVGRNYVAGALVLAIGGVLVTYTLPTVTGAFS